MVNKISKKDLVWAALFRLGIGGLPNLNKIAEAYGDIEEAWSNLKKSKINSQLRSIYSKRKIDALLTKIDGFSIERLEESLLKNSIEVLTLDSPLYPEKLKKIANAPLVIYCLGGSQNLNKISERSFGLAVVGSRRTSSYGQMAVNCLIETLSSQNFHLISGLAVGIDSMAHQKSLQIGKKNMAVLAGGLDKIYPELNQPLAKKIIDQGGCLISEFPPGAEYFKQNFPARNRIISGLCDSLLVIEAGKKSGALITARFALKQDKPVLAVPGSIFSSLSEGTNLLIQRGAGAVVNADQLGQLLFGQKKNKALAGRTKIDFSNLTPEQISILKTMEGSQTISLDELAKRTGFPAASVCAKITEFEINGTVERVGNEFCLRNN